MKSWWWCTVVAEAPARLVWSLESGVCACIKYIGFQPDFLINWSFLLFLMKRKSSCRLLEKYLK